MMEKTVHTAKQTVKARVEMASARVASLLGVDSVCSVIPCSMDGMGHAALWLKTKGCRPGRSRPFIRGRDRT